MELSQVVFQCNLVTTKIARPLTLPSYKVSQGLIFFLPKLFIVHAYDFNGVNMMFYVLFFPGRPSLC